MRQFDGCSSELIIYGRSGSYAETYAKSNKITFKDMSNIDGDNMGDNNTSIMGDLEEIKR